MEDECTVKKLKGLLAKARKPNEDESVNKYQFGKIAHVRSFAANDSMYQEADQKSPKPNHSSDKKSAKTSRLLLFLIKMLKRFFCHCFWVLVASLLSFWLFLSIDAEGQNNHSPTLWTSLLLLSTCRLRRRRASPEARKNAHLNLSNCRF